MRPGFPSLAAAILLGLALAVSCNGDGGGGVFEECGNGEIEGSEQCDDGNTVPCDGCSADCEDETGYVCGDGIVNAACGEQCDDGNTIPGDGCDANCMSEGCGNGVLDAGEECDDGNVLPCDGCSDSCTIEIGYICGDGTVNASCGEECDDGNVLPCDGCSDTCTTETGYICGDGIVNTSCGEQCDDGNTIPGDGCDANCMSEGCGNGVLDAGEECDDGNVLPCDGCSDTCTIEAGYICGDGTVNASCGEECDDGNVLSCDGCSDSCTIETGYICGDGTVNASCGEECDDGNTVKCDGCSDTCTIEVGYICGDGVLNTSCGEQCDDGNILPGDGCDANCQIEPLPIAGEYDLSIEPVLDTCGFGTTPTTSPMEVIELSQSQVTVNIPIGGAGGECNRETFSRQGNTVTRSESSPQQIGTCTVQVDATTSLTFFDDDTVTGFETNELTALGGDCSGLVLPCEVELTMSGSRCSGCFSCVMPSFAAARAGLGPLATGTGATLDAVRRSAGAD